MTNDEPTNKIYNYDNNAEYFYVLYFRFLGFVD